VVTTLEWKAGTTEVPVTVVSFWDSRDQAESVGEKVRGFLSKVLPEQMGLGVAGPPEVEVAEVEGRML
jgi:hypothetical protein